MDPRGRELEPVPRALQHMSAAGPVSGFHGGRIPMRIDPFGGRPGTVPLGPTDARRVLRVLREERRRGPAGYMHPDWRAADAPIPGLMFSIHYAGQDAHGITQHLRGLDLAFRRAASTLHAVADGEHLETWRPALRPERGGLWVGNSRAGSWECVGTVYGELVSLAFSTPVALTSLTSLAWQGSLAARRFGRWVAKQLPGRHAEGGPEAGELTVTEWGLSSTKALEPVMLEAIRAGHGMEFEIESAGTKIRLSVPARSDLERDSPA